MRLGACKGHLQLGTWAFEKGVYRVYKLHGCRRVWLEKIRIRVVRPPVGEAELKHRAEQTFHAPAHFSFLFS